MMMPVFLLLILFSTSVYAESPCRSLAKSMALDDPSLPLQADKDTQKNVLDIMHDMELLCKTVVKTIKTGERTPQDYQALVARKVEQAKLQYEKDGDIDKLERIKFFVQLVNRSLQVAEQ